jgi:hypothetical protein
MSSLTDDLDANIADEEGTRKPLSRIRLSKNLIWLVALPGSIGGLLTWVLGNGVSADLDSL